LHTSRREPRRWSIDAPSATVDDDRFTEQPGSELTGRSPPGACLHATTVDPEIDAHAATLGLRIIGESRDAVPSTGLDRLNVGPRSSAERRREQGDDDRARGCPDKPHLAMACRCSDRRADQPEAGEEWQREIERESCTEPAGDCAEMDRSVTHR